MKDGRMTQRLRRAADSVWEACFRHPFVQGIGDGTLPKEKFQYFMMQDYLYLFDYARVFALGVVKAPQPELMRVFARNVEGILNGEMEIHRAYMCRLGIAQEDVIAMKPALDNLAYTSYMRSVAHDGGAMEIVAAILACSWSYAEIGSRLAKIPDAANHPFYGEWIRGYADEAYAANNQALIDWMDALAADATEAQRAHLDEIFLNCSRFELAFWNMAWEMRT